MAVPLVATGRNPEVKPVIPPPTDKVPSVAIETRPVVPCPVIPVNFTTLVRVELAARVKVLAVVTP